jgi:hypothetical protein
VLRWCALCVCVTHPMDTCDMCMSVNSGEGKVFVGFFWSFGRLSGICARCMFTMFGGDVLIERWLSFALLPLFVFEFGRATYCGVLVQDLAYYVCDPMVWWSLFGVWTVCVCLRWSFVMKE